MSMQLTKRSLGPALVLFAIHLLFPSQAHGAGRRRVPAVSPPSAGPRLVFLEPLVDAGAMSWRGGSKRSTITTRTITLRIGESATESRGTATVRAFLETVDPRCTVRVDGVPLTTGPRVIRRHAPVGIAFSHRFEIEVPVTAADGPLQASIGWEVITD